MKRREQPKDIPVGEIYYTLPDMGVFSEDNWGRLYMRRPFSLGSIDIGRRLRPLLRSMKGDADAVGLPVRAFIDNPQVQADLGTLLGEAWAHPTYEPEATGAGLVQEFVEVVGIRLAPMIFARLIIEAYALASMDDIYAWEVEAVASAPFEADAPPSASA